MVLADKVQQKITPDRLEPGLLSAFRMLALLPAVLLVVQVWMLTASLLGSDPFSTPATITARSLVVDLLSLLVKALIVIYLFWPGVQMKLQRAFLPIAIIMTMSFPLVALAFNLFNPSGGADSDMLFRSYVVYQLVLFIPLIFIAWQYDWTAVALFCVFLVSYELTLWVLLYTKGDTRSSGLIEMLTLRTVAFGVFGYLMTQLVAGQRMQRRELAAANRQLFQHSATLEQLTVSRERNRMARELHDTLAHHMSSVVLQLEGVKMLWHTDEPQAQAILDKAITNVRDGATETRRALHALRVTPLTDLGLIGALQELTLNVAQRAGLAHLINLPSYPIHVPLPIEQAIYRVTQEALSNVERHAQAESVAVAVAERHGTLCLSVIDDGCGFDRNAVDVSERFGMKGMRERVEMVNGELSIQSQCGVGTTLTLSIPI